MDGVILCKRRLVSQQNKREVVMFSFNQYIRELCTVMGIGLCITAVIVSALTIAASL